MKKPKRWQKKPASPRPRSTSPSQATSERRRFHIRAEMAQQNLDEKLKTIVAVKDVAEMDAISAAELRAYFKTIQAGAGALVLACTSPAMVQQALRKIIYAALTDLSEGRHHSPQGDDDAAED